MAASQTALMTVQEMIDAAIMFDTGEPVVDFNMIESVLFILGRQLNVLERKVVVGYTTIQQSHVKLEKLEKRKAKIQVAHLNVHRKKASKKTKDVSATESGTEQSTSFKKHRHSRTRSKSKARAESDTERFSSSPKKSHHKRARPRSKSRTETETEQASSHRSTRSRSKSTSKARSRSKSEEKSGKGRRAFKGDNLDVLYDKLLVVSRTSLEDHRGLVVTQEQYDKMLSDICTLQKKFGVIPNMDNSWSNLHKATSITDPRAALIIATKLEASQKKLNEMLEVISKYASTIPGIFLDGPIDDRFLHKPLKSLKETTDSAEATRTSSATSTLMAIVAPTKTVSVEEIDYENLGTWSELNLEMDDIQNNMVKSLTQASGLASDAAKRASALFKEYGPKLARTSICHAKFARLSVLIDRFTNDANALDINLAETISDCQEKVSNLQFEVDMFIERLDFTPPAEDPTELLKNFADFQFDLASANNIQTELKVLQKQSGADFQRIQKVVDIVGKSKITREETVESLKDKVRVIDINGLLSREQLCAAVEFMLGNIRQTKHQIESGETQWQITIDKYVTHLYEKCNLLQVITLNQSLRDHYRAISTRVNTMLNIAGEYPVNMFKKKMDRDGNCLSCGIPAEIKVFHKNMQLARRLFNREVVKPELDEEESSPIPCIPGLPIPHPLDPRALVCERYCGASISKTGKSLSSSLGLDVTDINIINSRPKAGIGSKVK